MHSVVASITLPRYAVICILGALRRDQEANEAFKSTAKDTSIRQAQESIARTGAADSRELYGLLAPFDNGDFESITITPNYRREDEEKG